ncbi:transcriptional regulator [Natronobacterium gregoryi]|uniref:Transcriptional regulator n=2 Tax=Natronobacterium gregoryi TaxID=44930 RepID=L0ACT3_NATGS|nr:transcriptional regulator [Natronobacterium gregoryi]AFZ71646.1 putative transcriptional regulator [Natronobacterium gregoryi SP2]ELY66265.1 transcriptional regulator TrmB [Natronobacterium gregoryi SP2]PLK18752.1 transcriptional regulator [Natronobacterium gregoryi SP2]SFJ65333.1 Predicted transcriptional regulator [Natronobacterium gregoryi]
MNPDDTDDHGGKEDASDLESDREPAFDEETEERIRTTAAEEVDQRIVDLLSWILDTETRAKIYVHSLANPGSTSEEIAKGTGLYPSTVREALAELHDEERVTREKRASEGAGNNPYEYTAIQPSELVGGVVDQVQQELNAIVTLDQVFDRDEDDPSEPAFGEDAEPVTITVDDTGPFEDDETNVDVAATEPEPDEKDESEPSSDDEPVDE